MTSGRISGRRRFGQGPLQLADGGRRVAGPECPVGAAAEELDQLGITGRIGVERMDGGLVVARPFCLRVSKARRW